MSGDYLTGRFSNLVFEDVSQVNSVQAALTNKAILIVKAIYLREIAQKTNRHYLLHYTYDKDSNGDGKLDEYDILSLYISNLDGTGFAKISQDNQEFETGKLIGFASRYYFRAIEDTNKDGYFNKEDKYHYYYIDFSGEQYRIVASNPVGLTK